MVSLLQRIYFSNTTPTHQRCLVFILPLALSIYGALEVISGLPLGASAVRDPRLEVLSRQLRWLVTLANLPGLVGSLHRQQAVVGDAPWADPTPALSGALETMCWTLVGMRPVSVPPAGQPWTQWWCYTLLLELLFLQTQFGRMVPLEALVLVPVLRPLFSHLHVLP